MRFLTAFLLGLGASALAAQDPEREVLGRCSATLGAQAFSDDAKPYASASRAYAEGALAALSPGSVAVVNALSPVDFARFVTENRDAQQKIPNREKVRVGLLLREKFFPALTALEEYFGDEPSHFAPELLPAIVAYTADVLEGRYGDAERQRLHVSMEAARRPGGGFYQNGYALPVALAAQIERLVALLGTRERARFLQGSILFAQEKLRLPVKAK